VSVHPGDWVIAKESHEGMITAGLGYEVAAVRGPDPDTDTMQTIRLVRDDSGNSREYYAYRFQLKENNLPPFAVGSLR
jgi:hypothetical protein